VRQQSTWSPGSHSDGMLYYTPHLQPLCGTLRPTGHPSATAAHPAIHRTSFNTHAMGLTVGMGTKRVQISHCWMHGVQSSERSTRTCAAEYCERPDMNTSQSLMHLCCRQMLSKEVRR
jgi:hypothetical protein